MVQAQQPVSLVDRVPAPEEHPTAIETVLEDQVEVIGNLFREDRHLDCHQAICVLVQSAKAGACKRRDGSQVSAADQDLQAFISGDIVQLEIEQKKLYNEFMSEIEEKNLDTWKVYKSKDTVKKNINVRWKENEGRITMLMDVEIDAPVEHCMAIFYEIDLMSTWAKEMKNCDFWAKTSDFSGGWCGTMKFPSPIWDRFMRVSMISYADKRCNGVLNVSRSIPLGVTHWGGVQVPDIPKKNVEIQAYRVYDYFERLDNGKTRYCGLGEMSLGMKLPDMIMNYFMKSFGYMQMDQMKKVAEGMKDNQQYMERVNGTKKDLYAKLTKLLE